MTKAEKIRLLATKHARRVAKLEHALVGAGALGVVTGVHAVEIASAAMLVGIEGLLLLAANQVLEV